MAQGLEIERLPDKLASSGSTEMLTPFSIKALVTLKPEGSKASCASTLPETPSKRVNRIFIMDQDRDFEKCAGVG
jgi:hypothetical protein